MFLLYTAGGNSSLLLYPAGGNSLVLLSLAGKQFDLTYFYREETNLYLYFPLLFVSFLQVKVRLNCFNLHGKVRADYIMASVKDSTFPCPQGQILVFSWHGGDSLKIKVPTPDFSLCH